MFERDYVSQFFDQDALLKMIDDNYAGKTDDRRKIWTCVLIPDVVRRLLRARRREAGRHRHRLTADAVRMVTNTPGPVRHALVPGCGIIYKA